MKGLASMDAAVSGFTGCGGAPIVNQGHLPGSAGILPALSNQGSHPKPDGKDIPP